MKDSIRKIIREAIREMNEDIVGGPTKTRDDCSCWDFCGNACSDEGFAAACQVKISLDKLGCNMV